MRISIQSPSEDRGESKIGQELERVFEVLHSVQIRVLEGGRSTDGCGYVVLAHESDGPAALAALAQAGIQASEIGLGTETKS